MTVAKNIKTIKEQIHSKEAKYGRNPESVQLLAVTKKHSVNAIQEAYAAGQRCFGENFVQEAMNKIETINQHDIEWHFIGHIQSNKTRKIAENFHWVHSITSPQIAERLHQQRPESLPPLNVCLEVNVSHEQTKGGINYVDVLPLAELCASFNRLKLRGLMAIPALHAELIDQRAEFYKLRLLFDELNKKNFQLDTLSMGTTQDMEAAIAEGATIVRIGTAIFGTREV